MSTQTGVILKPHIISDKYPAYKGLHPMILKSMLARLYHKLLDQFTVIISNRQRRKASPAKCRQIHYSQA